MLSKQKIRKKFISIRRKKYFSVSKSFFKPLIKLIYKENKKKISLYYPSNYELDATELFRSLKKKYRISTSLPVISSDGKMKFVKWTLSEPLIVNNYGFLEPAQKKTNMFPDLIIVPMLAFDKARNRLGYGKGYYDRFLKKYRKNRKNILTIGLAFSFQKYKKIPTSNHDVKLDHILTEKGIF